MNKALDIPHYINVSLNQDFLSIDTNENPTHTIPPQAVCQEILVLGTQYLRFSGHPQKNASHRDVYDLVGTVPEIKILRIRKLK